MTNDNENLIYVKQILQAAEGPNNYPSIYFLWGCIVFVGYVIAEYRIDLTATYWLISAPVGMLVSAWLGRRQGNSEGQQDSRVGRQYMQHFGLMVVFIFAAMFSGEYQSILLIIGLGYCLAGLYLDRLMFVVGSLSLIAFVAVELGLIQSNLFLGGIIASGFFITAWCAARLNNGDMDLKG
ncbi:MAG: hypothetical protein ACJA2E_001516 [Arenicella sp.]|jgi:hypothetical protein